MNELTLIKAICIADNETVFLIYIEALDQYLSVFENCLYDRDSIDFTNEAEIIFKETT